MVRGLSDNAPSNDLLKLVEDVGSNRVTSVSQRVQHGVAPLIWDRWLHPVERDSVIAPAYHHHRIGRLGSRKIKIFDRERTVVDSFRYLDKETALKALQAYLKTSKGRKPDINKLLRYSKKPSTVIQKF